MSHAQLQPPSHGARRHWRGNSEVFDHAFRLATAVMPCAVPDSVFVAMLPGYRSTGGIATGSEIAGRLAQCDGASLPALAERMSCGELLSFEWRGNLWLPMFQFEDDMRVAPGPCAIVAELAGVFAQRWELAHWFVQPHAALQGRTPVQVVCADAGAALDAARIDRFIALG